MVSIRFDQLNGLWFPVFRVAGRVETETGRYALRVAAGKIDRITRRGLRSYAYTAS